MNNTQSIHTFQNRHLFNLSYNAGITICLFIISPLISLPFILSGIYNKKKSAFLLFSIFLGLLAWLQIPLGDLFRHSMSFFRLYDKPISRIFDFSDGFHDFIGSLGKWILVNNGFPYEWFRFLSITECFYLQSLIFLWMIKNSNREYSKNEVFNRFIILVLFFELIMTTSGTRYCFAVYNFVYGLHLLLNKKNYFLSVIFFIFSICIHDTLIFFIPICLLLYLLCYKKKNIIIIFILSTLLSLTFLGYLQGYMGRRSEFYFENGSSIDGNTFEKVTIYGLILSIYMRFLILPFSYISFKEFSYKLKWARMMMVFTIMLLVLISNQVLIFRVAAFMEAIACFVLINIENVKTISRRLFRVLLICSLLCTIFNTINYREIILNSRYQYIALPLPYILSTEYDKEWIILHVDNNKMKLP